MHVPGEPQHRQVCQRFIQSAGHHDVGKGLVGCDVCIPVGVCPAQETQGWATGTASTKCKSSRACIKCKLYVQKQFCLHCRKSGCCTHSNRQVLAVCMVPLVVQGPLRRPAAFQLPHILEDVFVFPELLLQLLLWQSNMSAENLHLDAQSLHQGVQRQ